MKTLFSIFILAGGLLLFSCTNGDQMLTVINPDGSCYREFSNIGDSAFMVGDTAKGNKFPIDLDSTWKISWKYKTSEIHTNWPLKTWKDDTIKELKSSADSVNGENHKITFVWARRNYKSVEEMASTFKLKKSHDWNDLKIQYSLDKKFRWFYTYYTYQETYPKLKTLDRIPLDKYMTKAEAELWFNGKHDMLKGMNGVEIKDYITRIEGNYNNWFGHNFWDAEYEVLLNNYSLLKGLNISKERLEIAKDSVFNKNIDKFKTLEDDPDFGKCMDEYFQTKAFSDFYNQKGNPLKQFEDEFGKMTFLKYFESDMEYRLIMPGKILQADNAVMYGDTLSWKLTAYRMVYSDYAINAQSRKTNNWAFIVSALIVLAAIGSFLYKRR